MDKKDLEKLKAMMDTEGGKYLRDMSRDVVANNIEVLMNTFKDKSLVEIQGICAVIQANLSQYKLLSNINSQIEAIKELYKEST